MDLSVFEDDGVVVMSLDGTIGFDGRGFSLVADIDANLQRAIKEGKTRFVLDLTNARAKIPSAANIVFGPFLKLARNENVKVAVVPSREQARGRSSLLPTARASRFSQEDLKLMTRDFLVFQTVDDAIAALQNL